jgi:hypothetical protein
VSSEKEVNIVIEFLLEVTVTSILAQLVKEKEENYS